MKERPSLAVHEQRDVKEALRRLQARDGLKAVFRVERLAKRGVVHPDPEVTALALQWARAILAAEPRYTNKSLLVCYLTEILSGGFNRDGSRAILERTSLKVAARIVHAHEAMTTPQ